MIVSITTNRISSRWLQVLVLLISVSIPLGSAGAQDKKTKGDASPKDIYRQIEAAVKAGKITKEESAAKLNALKQKGSPKKYVKGKGKAVKKGASPKDIYQQIEAAVKAGKITKEQAAAKLKPLKTKGPAKKNVKGPKKKGYDKKGAKGKKVKTKASPKDIYQQIEAAVKAGKITKEQAATKLNALKQKGSPQEECEGSD